MKIELTHEQQLILNLWLKHYDRAFYGERMKLDDAAEKLEEETSIKLSGSMLSKFAKLVCKFWLAKLGASRPKSKARGFTSNGWQAQMNWVRKNAAEIDPKLDTVASVFRRMLFGGVKCNLASTREAIDAAHLEQPIQYQVPPFQMPKLARVA